jgi:hypothetical protein
MTNYVFEQKEKEISNELLKRSTSTSFAASSMSNPTPTTTATTSISRSIPSASQTRTNGIYGKSPGAKFNTGKPKTIIAQFSDNPDPRNAITSNPQLRYQQQQQQSELDVANTKSPAMHRILNRNNQPMSANMNEVHTDIYGDYDINNGYGPNSPYMVPSAQPASNYSQQQPIYRERDEPAPSAQKAYFEERRRRSNELLNSSTPPPPPSQPQLRKPVPQNLCNGEYSERAISRYSKNIVNNYPQPVTKPAAYPNGKFFLLFNFPNLVECLDYISQFIQ